MNKENSIYETLYSPSRFNVRMSPEAVVQKHIQVVTDISEGIRSGSIPSRLNVPYGDDDSSVLDIFGTNLSPDSPIFIYFSGGYWQQLNGTISSYPVAPMYQAGVVSIIVHYKRAPGISVSDIVDRCTEAMRWIHNYATSVVKARCLTMAGHSAGAQICAMILASSWFASLTAPETRLYEGVALISGIFELRPLLRTTINDALLMDEEEAIRNSPLHIKNVTKIVSNLNRKGHLDCNILLIVAEHDSPAFKDQAASMAQALQSRGMNGVYGKTFSSVDHFDIVEKLSEPTFELTKLLIELNARKYSIYNQHMTYNF